MSSSPMSPLIKYKFLASGASIDPKPVVAKDTRAQAAEAKSERKVVPVNDITKDEFGDLPTIQSAYKTERNWVDIGSLTLEDVGKDVWIRARIHTMRVVGKNGFVLLRRGFSSIQCTMFALGREGDASRDMLNWAKKIPNESVVDIHGVVVKAEQIVEKASQKEVEVSIKQFFLVNASEPKLPFQLEDAAKPPPKDVVEGGEGKDVEIPLGYVGQSLRLDNRWIDLRTPANHAIFRLQSKVAQYYRDFFLQRNFVEIHTPKILPGVSEGGTQVFKFKYFKKEVCLAQSPQLYKQMAVISDLFKVFEIGPVFRAEDSNTHRHMCEFTGMDFEMEVKEHYHEVTKMLGDVFVYIFDQITANCQAELAAVNKQYPFEPLKYHRETLILSFEEARAMLKEAGSIIPDMTDINTEQEKKLGQLIKAKYDTEFYIVDRYPTPVRPFYTMPCKDDSRYTCSYDVFLRGQEITSGAQRIHEVDLLKRRAEECGIPVSNIEKYLESFKYGAYPHGGAGIGLERVVMLYLNLDNIRKTSMFPRTPNRLSP